MFIIKRALLATLLFCAAHIVAQNNNSPYTVTGTLTDSTRYEGIPYATISAAKAAQPTVYVKRMASGIDGEFTLQLNEAGEYIISFESIGMQTTQRKVQLTDSKTGIDLGEILISESKEALEELNVVAQKPLVKTDMDKIIYDLESDPDAQTSNTLEMLRKVPMVTVDGNDEIQVKGSTNFKVFINGKPSKMTEKDPAMVLKSIPASTIKNIELITEPGVKYDAEGVGGIINIVTTKTLAGYSGSVTARVGSNGEYMGGAYITSKVGKLGVTANLNYYRQDRFQPMAYHSERENFSSTSIKHINETGTTDQVFNMGNGNLDLSYEFDSLNLLSFSMGGRIGAWNQNNTIQTYMLNQTLDTVSSYDIDRNSTGLWGGLNTSLDYQHSFAKKDQLLTVSYQWSRRPDNGDNISDVHNTLNYPSYKQRIVSKAAGDEHTVQVDYTEPFNKIHVLEAGAKHILRLNNSDNDYYLFDTQQNDWATMLNKENTDLKHTQNIASAYASYALKLEKFSFRVGARLEHTMQNVNMNDTTFIVNFTNLIPAISLSYRPAMGQDIRLSYNQRMRRPGIWHLNPHWDDSNPLSIKQGNPNLDATLAHHVSLVYSYFTQKVSMNLNAWGSYTNNAIQSVTKQLNDSTLYTTYQNIGTEYKAGGTAYINWMVSKSLRLYTSINGQYINMMSPTLDNSGWNYSIHGGGNASLPYKLKLNGFGGFQSGRIQLQGKSGGYYYYGLSLSRAFVEEKLNVSIMAMNFAERTQSMTSYTETEHFRNTNTNSWPAMNFGVSASYRFGEMREQIKKAKRGIKNDDMMEGGGNSGSQAGQGGQGQ